MIDKKFKHYEFLKILLTRKVKYKFSGITNVSWGFFPSLWFIDRISYLISMKNEDLPSEDAGIIKS